MTEIATTYPASPAGAEVARCAYQEQASTQTVREALEEYRRANAAVLNQVEQGEGAAFFRSHDMCHVIFGCSTSLDQEAAVDVWTIFGGDISFRDYLAYLKLQEAQDIVRDIGYLRSLWSSVRALPLLARVFVNARRMSKKFPWTGHEQFLDRTLASVRDEFNIRVVS